MAFDSVFQGPPEGATAPGTHQSPALGVDVANKELYISSGSGWEPIVGAVDPPLVVAETVTDGSQDVTQGITTTELTFTPKTAVGAGNWINASKVSVTADLSGQAETSFSVQGLEVDTTNNTNGQTVDSVFGEVVGCVNAGTGHVSNLFGISSGIASIAGTVGSAFSLFVNQPDIDGSTVDSLCGLFIHDPSVVNGGVITENVGINLQINDGVTGVTAAFSIKSTGSAIAQFAGPVEATYTKAHVVYSAAGTPLPSASTAGMGARAFVSDANSSTFAAAYVSGGTNKVPVYSDGTAWHIG